MSMPRLRRRHREDVAGLTQNRAATEGFLENGVAMLASPASARGMGSSAMVLNSFGRRMTPQSPNEALQPEAPPPPPPKPPSRRRPTLSALSGFVSFLVIVAVAALAGLAWINSQLHEPGPLVANKVVYIVPHTDLPDIIEKLDAEGVIDSPLTMNAVLTAERKRAKVKAGEFLFKQHASLRDVIDTLVSGKQYLHAFTIPEGLTSQQIAQRIRDSDLLSGDVRDMPKEGALLPETYKVFRGMTRSDLLIKMQEDDRRTVEQIWARRAPDLPLRSPFDLVTLASIVEKETGKADERSRVAGVFINRLRKHMRLQSDPTIVYGLVAGQGTLGHSITRAELDRRTPYNTYQVDGLPPGPIDNPGRAALEAVANPSRTSDLYFVADGTGGHAFAETVDEHNKNVQRWRQIERDAKDKVDVDKLSPSAVAPPPKLNQRSDADDAVFGVLPSDVTSVSVGRVASFVDPTSNHDIDKVFAAVERGPTSTPRRTRAGVIKTASAMPDPASYTRSVDTMGFSLDGPAPKGSDVLDGPITPTAAPSASTSADATPPTRQATAAAAVVAARPVGTRESRISALDATTPEHPDLFSESEGGATGAAPMKTPPPHPKIYDASEDTPLDPLRNKTFDLNTAKTIPADLVH